MFSCSRSFLEEDHVGDKKSDADGNEAKSSADKAQIAVEETRQSERDDDEQAEVCARHAIGSDSARDQFHPPEDEGAQEDLAQLDVRLDQRADLLRGQLEYARRAARPCAHDDRASREQIDVPRDIKGAHSNHSFADKQGCHRILIISEVVAKFPAGDIRVGGFAEASSVDGKHNHPRCH